VSARDGDGGRCTKRCGRGKAEEVATNEGDQQGDGSAGRRDGDGGRRAKRCG
jgi:hypothetical protein